jgi:subtilisin family serine protease
MATPHVTGAAALYASSHPGANAAGIKSAILGSVVPTASCNGKVSTNGRLNASGF